ncbi:hypothetical protein BHE74_00025292 [Ensete ventricosum]|nr:hypothetical protein GW17_00017610 [Ensete ventricosum]RWW67278.1 hypothetical protein BHE74_00025292 [Ensete ventricosum]RZS28845.1 hypothetical protein BHM03_00062500 [Ensete ventricosum]
MDLARIVGFEVKPFRLGLSESYRIFVWLCFYRVMIYYLLCYSVKHEYEGQWNENKTRLSTCDPHAKRSVLNSDAPQEVAANNEIIFTYDIEFELKKQFVALSLVPPSNSDLLCVYVGTGIQFFGMLLVTMIFAVLGFLSPSNRGGLMTAMLLLWVFMGLFAGYSSARLYKLFKGTEWKKITLKTAFTFPGIVFAIFFVLNALIWGEKSSGAVPFTTMFALVLLWFGISVPLVFVGSYLGFKKPAPEDPVKTNKIPRQIPEQAWYMNPVFSILIGGILPFGAVFIELFFILTSIWLHQFYYIFGFLFLVFLILIVTCAEITIVLCYFQLCSEDYLWWWRSYLTSGSSALYLFLYATFYFFTKLEITKLVSGLLYFGYMLIASYAFFVLTGTIGFCACFWFTRLIYSSVKVD